MYRPAAFREDRIEELHAAIRAAPLAALVVQGSDGLDASHVPVLIDPDPAPRGTLIGHLAKANPHARADGAMAMAIFLGPHAYISPNWYPSKQDTHRVVPTWNYVAVHAHGRIELFDDAAALRSVVQRLTGAHEQGRPAPWSLADAPEDFIRAQLKGIIGFRMPIERLEGKWKMSQNRPAPDRAGVSRALRHENPAVAALVQERSPA